MGWKFSVVIAVRLRGARQGLNPCPSPATAGPLLAVQPEGDIPGDLFAHYDTTAAPASALGAHANASLYHFGSRFRIAVSADHPGQAARM